MFNAFDLKLNATSQRFVKTFINFLMFLVLILPPFVILLSAKPKINANGQKTALKS